MRQCGSNERQRQCLMEIKWHVFITCSINTFCIVLVLWTALRTRVLHAILVEYYLWILPY
jgi:hypothetical protein